MLQKSYLGQVKMIYIDPPYNTGNDSFVYPDDYTERLSEYKRRTGLTDENGFINKQDLWRKNSKENGQYHSVWLSMMYPRLYLAKNLLRDDGVIFISIDDNEQSNLKLLCDEIFGAENFIGCAARVTKKSNNKGEFWAPNFDYVLSYTKNKEYAKEFFGGANIEAYDQIETEGDRKGEKYQLVRLYMSSIQNRNPDQRFYIECPDGSKVIPPGTTFPPERPNLGDGIWRWTRRKIESERDKIVIKAVKSSNLIDENNQPAKYNVFTKTYLNDVIENSSAKPNSLIENFINQMSSHELTELGIPFDYAKPSKLIDYLLKVAQVGKDDIILDFFAGSGTTAQAVMEYNLEDTGGNRQFICVQMPEVLEENSEAYKAGYCTIADITRARIGKVITKLKAEKPAETANLACANFTVNPSNFKVWQSNVSGEGAILEQLEMFQQSENPTSTHQNMLTELLLKMGLGITEASAVITPLSVVNTQIYEVKQPVQNTVYWFCFSPYTAALKAEIVKAKPQQVILLNTCFVGDNADEQMTNLKLELKTHDIKLMLI